MNWEKISAHFKKIYEVNFVNWKKIAVIIHKTEEDLYNQLIDSVKKLNVPKGCTLDIVPVEGDEKFAAYNAAMKENDAKFKIYIDEKVTLLDKNILVNILKLFKSDKKIGVIGISGAINISTHGVCLDSAKRCGKVFMGAEKKLVNWGDIKGDYQEVESVDGFLMATQYDIDWREDIFHSNSFGDNAQCLEFRRKGYKVVVMNTEEPIIWFNQEKWLIDGLSRENFLNEYSEDIYPLATIMIPTFNRPHYFKLALESALNQTYRNIEVVVSDNSTEDDTEKLMQEYLAKDPRIKYFRHKDFTANDNWNFCRKYNNPKAEYLNWLMDDDLFYPRKLEVMVEIYRNNPDISLVTSVRDVIDVDGRVVPMRMPQPAALNKTMKVSGDEAGRMMFHTGKNYIGEPTTVLIRKKFLRNNDMCWTEEEDGFYSLVDISTWCQLLTQGNLLWIQDQPLSAFRRHAKQVTNWAGNGAVFETSWARIFKTAWEKRAFIHNERELRYSLINWLYSASLRLVNAFQENYDGEEIVTLEKTMVAVATSLRNGYKIDLPPRYYGAKTDAGRLS